MKKIELLRDLQAVDSELDSSRAALERCKARLGDDGELVPLREEARAAAARAKTLQSRAKDLDAEMESKGSRMKADEKKLYSGSVKNPKELGSLSHEVDIERQQISKLEDQALANMDALDEASAALKAAESRLAETERSWKSEQASLQAEHDGLSGRIASLTSQRAEIAGSVEPADMKGYEQLRRSRGGLAVVPVEQRSCQGCRIALTLSVVQRARSGQELVTCQNCGRILFIPS